MTATATSTDTASAHTVSQVELQLRIVQDALSKLCELANEDGTIGDELTQQICEQVFALSLDDAAAEISALNDRTDEEKGAAWLVVHGAKGARQLLGTARSHREALELIGENAGIVSAEAPVMIAELPFGSPRVTVHDGDGIVKTVDIANFSWQEL